MCMFLCLFVLTVLKIVEPIKILKNLIVVIVSSEKLDGNAQLLITDLEDQLW